MSFTVGNNKVDNRYVNADLVRKWADSAKRIEVEGNASPDSWEKLAKGAAKNDGLSQADVDQITNLGKACFKYHKQLHADFKASGYKDMAIKDRLSDVHVFTTGSDAVKKAIARSQAETAVAAAAPASFGPTGVVAAYAAAARLADEELKALVDSVASMRASKSELVFAGNKIQGFHIEEIWPQMIRMLDKAAESARGGKPTEVNAQYYELTNQQIVGKLAAAAEAGNKVRVNVDAGRLVAYKGSHVVIDEVPDKLRAILQLNSTKGDIAVSAYPVPKQLGDPGNLMHRKGLRVGDEFLLSGMNANEGSGENVDAGYVIQGPAAKKLVSNFARDVAQSTGASNEDIYGEKPLAGFMDGDINMGTRGLVALLDCAKGPGKAGTSLPQFKTFAEVEDYAKSKGLKAAELIDCKPAEAEELLAKDEALPLSKQGKQAFLDLVDRALGSCRSKESVSRLKDISIPSGKPVGKADVALADFPTDRETLMITAIQEAEKFIYIPAFVMTGTIAEMLVAKKEEMEAAGKKIDIRVIADPGVYPDGGTPNEAGMERLEDAGIPCRWANLPRSGWHDRKIHAKEILTDKGEFFGSTNFSKKGLRENWEHSGYVKFDESNRDEQEHSVQQFNNLWDNESFELNSLERGKKLKNRDRDRIDFAELVDESRYGTTRDIIGGIEKAEKDTGAFTSEQAKDPKTAARVAELEKAGYDEGSAVILAVQEKLGKAEFYKALDELPARKELHQLH
ncbi:MAG: phospholipase D-like domain-containing protein [Vulcanimicrobiota bacterium]